MTREELELELRRVPDVREVSIVGNGRLIATVVSGSFEGRDEGERQAEVWGLLYASHTDDDLRNIEFIFTNAPNERNDDAPAV